MEEEIREILWDFVRGELTDSEAIEKIIKKYEKRNKI